MEKLIREKPENFIWRLPDWGLGMICPDLSPFDF